MSISELSEVSKGASAGLAQRLEIFTGAGRRRSWTSAQKAAIVAESFEDGALVGHVARRPGLTPQQLFNWRRQARREAEKGAGALPFVPGVVETPSVRRRPRRASRANRRLRVSLSSNWTSRDRASGSGATPRPRW